MTSQTMLKTMEGGCHCGRVRFRVKRCKLIGSSPSGWRFLVGVRREQIVKIAR